MDAAARTAARANLLLWIASLGVAGCASESKVSPTGEGDPATEVEDDPADTSPGDDPAEEDPQEDPQEEEEEEDLPSDYVVDEEEPDALLTPDDVSAAIADGFRELKGIDPYLVLDAYQAAVVAQQDDYCPYYYEDYAEIYGYYYWYGGCTSYGGSSFDGYAYGNAYTDVVESGYYRYDKYGWWYGDAGVSFADGGSFELSGSFSMADYEYLPGAYNYFYAYLTGSVLWEGPEYEDTWLSRGLSLSLAISGMRNYSGGGSVSFDGGLSGLDGASDTIDFDAVYLFSAEAGSDCPAEPSGTISIRDADGEWYDVIFDGAAYYPAEVFPADCDGCGQVWYRGQLLGTACPDFSDARLWEDWPW